MIPVSSIRLPLLCAAGLTAALLLLPTTGHAQGQPAESELTALGYYAQQGDQDATAAELRRLRLKYPGWTPPADLSRITVKEPSGPDIDQIYREIAAGKLTEARASITRMQGEWPSWTPPATMLELIDTAEGQTRLDRALSAKDVDAASAAVTASPGLLRCDRINNAWRIADTQRSAGQPGRALGTYRAVLQGCSRPADLIATLEKADAVSSVEELAQLVAIARSRAPGSARQIDALHQRLLAGRPEGAALAAEAGAGASGGATVKARPQDTPPAKAPAATGGKTAEARPTSRNVAAPSGVGGGSGGGSAVQNLSARGDWRACLAAAARSRANTDLYMSGWCAYNLDRTMEAIDIFRRALAGKLTGEQRRDANYGLALAFLKAKMPEDASRLAARTDFSRSQRIDIERQILDQRGVLAYKRGEFRRSIEYFNALEGLGGGMRRDLAIMRAYAYLNSGQRHEARRAFQELNNQLSTNETRRGLRAAGGS